MLVNEFHYFMNRYRRLTLVFSVIGGLICMNPVVRTVSRMASSYIANSNSVAYVTAPNEELAKKLARGLVEKKMAACVNIVPKVISVYEWDDKINEDSEVLMMIKTRSSRVDDVVSYIKENHPYDCPEVISLPIESGSSAYLKWVSDTVGTK